MIIESKSTSNTPFIKYSSIPHGCVAKIREPFFKASLLASVFIKLVCKPRIYLLFFIAASTVEAQIIVAKQIAEQISDFFKSGKVVNEV